MFKYVFVAFSVAFAFVSAILQEREERNLSSSSSSDSDGMSCVPN